jgi:hypothetical protein
MGSCEEAKAPKPRSAHAIMTIHAITPQYSADCRMTYDQSTEWSVLGCHKAATAIPSKCEFDKKTGLVAGQSAHCSSNAPAGGKRLQPLGLFEPVSSLTAKRLAHRRHVTKLPEQLQPFS